jgi:uncharacterized membrane protein YcfT
LWWDELAANGGASGGFSICSATLYAFYAHAFANLTRYCAPESQLHWMPSFLRPVRSPCWTLLLGCGPLLLELHFVARQMFRGRRQYSNIAFLLASPAWLFLIGFN